MIKLLRSIALLFAIIVNAHAQEVVVSGKVTSGLDGGDVPGVSIRINNSNQGTPVVMDQQSDAAQAYGDAIKRFLGEEQPHRFLTAEKRGFFSRLFSPTNAYAG